MKSGRQRLSKGFIVEMGKELLRGMSGLVGGGEGVLWDEGCRW